MGLFVHTSSNKDKTHQAEKKFAKSLVDALDLGEEKSYASFLTSARSSTGEDLSPIPKLSRKQARDSTLYKQAIDKFDGSLIGQSIEVDKAVSSLINTLLISSRERINVPRVAILLTDTLNLTLSSEYVKTMTAARVYINFVAVGVGENFNRTFLDEYTGIYIYIYIMKSNSQT